jgi:hypothetical protein
VSHFIKKDCNGINDFAIPALISLVKLTNIKHFKISNFIISPECISFLLDRCDNVKLFTLSNYSLSTSWLNEFMPQFKQNDIITEFSINYANLDDEKFSIIAKNLPPQLDTIILKNNDIGSIGIKELVHHFLENDDIILKKLDLSNNKQINDVVVLELVQLINYKASRKTNYESTKLVLINTSISDCGCEALIQPVIKGLISVSLFGCSNISEICKKKFISETGLFFY